MKRTYKSILNRFSVGPLNGVLSSKSKTSPNAHKHAEDSASKKMIRSKTMPTRNIDGNLNDNKKINFKQYNNGVDGNLLDADTPDFDGKVNEFEFFDAKPIPGFSREDLSPSIDLNHQELIYQATVNRKYTSQFYVYDSSVYIGPVDENVLYDVSFNIFDKPNGFNPTSCRYIIHYLSMLFKEKYTGNDDRVINLWTELCTSDANNVFSIDSEQYRNTSKKIKTLFPWDGCTLQGEFLFKKLKELYKDDVYEMLVSMILIWSKFSLGLVPWISYSNFSILEQRSNFALDVFYKKISDCLPDHDYTCVCFEFLEFLCYFVSANLFHEEKSKLINWVYCMSAVCFNITGDGPLDNIIEWSKISVKHGNATFHLFTSYLRSLYVDKKLTDFYIVDYFEILKNYPMCLKNNKALIKNSSSNDVLCLSIPKTLELLNTNEKSLFENMFLRCSILAENIKFNCDSIFNSEETKFLEMLNKYPSKIHSKLITKESTLLSSTIDRLYNSDNNLLENIKFKTVENGVKFGESIDIRNILFSEDSQYRVADWIDLNFENDNVFMQSFTLNECIKDEEKKLHIEETSSLFVDKLNLNKWLIQILKFDLINKKLINTMLLDFKYKIGNCKHVVIFLDKRVETAHDQELVQNFTPCDVLNREIVVSSIDDSKNRNNKLTIPDKVFQPNSELMNSLEVESTTPTESTKMSNSSSSYSLASSSPVSSSPISSSLISSSSSTNTKENHMNPNSLKFLPSLQSPILPLRVHPYIGSTTSLSDRNLLVHQRITTEDHYNLFIQQA